MAGSIWKGSISFGLLNIPVTLQKAQEGSGLSFSLLDEDDYSPIKYKKVSAKTGKEVPMSRIVKGYEYESGQFAILDKDDFKRANPKATQTIDLEDFVSFEQIDLMFFDRPYYLVPQKSGIKGYFLLRDALKKTNKVAVGKIIIRTKMHLVCLMAKGDYLILELLRFAHEVIELNEVNYLDGIEEPKINAKEVKMAMELIDGMTADWAPEKYHDTYNDDIMRIIDQKIKKGEKAEVYYDEDAKIQAPNTNVVDLMPLLKKSLAMKNGKKKKTTRKSANG
jgi:DNA end-binding protein Ku